MPVSILIAEDDEDDFVLCRRALKPTPLGERIHWVRDGAELLDFLLRRGRFGDAGPLPAPLIILLDLNMPRMDGREALRAIRADPGLRRLPVTILSTSGLEEDVAACHDLGANSYIHKPSDPDRFSANISAHVRYWLETVELPDNLG